MFSFNNIYWHGWSLHSSGLLLEAAQFNISVGTTSMK